MLLLLVALALLVLAAVPTTRLLRPASLLDAAIGFGVVASALVAAPILLAGALGILGRAPVLGLLAGWAMIAWALVGRADPPPALGRPRLPALRGHGWESILVALAAVALAWQLIVALILPPFAFDAISYHLTVVASWLDAESVDPSALSLCCAYYPSNSELVFAWPMLFTGSVGVVDTVQFPFVVLGALSVAGLVRSARLPPAASAAAAAIFTATPIVLVQAPTDYADVMVAAWALAGLHSIVRFAVSGQRSHLVVAGLAAGLLVGTKGTGIVWAAALTLLAIGVVVAFLRGRRLPTGAAVRGLAAFVCALLALGSYWYARNWIEQGNPAYPFRVEVAGQQIFDGPFEVDDVLTQPPAGAGDPRPVPIARSWAADLDFWNQGSYDYQQRAGGLGPLWPWLALPLLIPLTVWLVRRRSPVLLALGGVAAVLVVQPYGWWSRFTIPLIAIGALAVVAAAAWSPRRWQRLAVRGLALGLVVVGVGLASYEVDPAANADPLRADDVLGLIGDSPDQRSVGSLFFPEYAFLDQVPDDATVAVDLGAPEVRFVFPLFGPDLSREVVPAGSTGEAAAGAWVVTARGRPLDRELARDPAYRLAASVNGVRVWRPAG